MVYKSLLHSIELDHIIAVPDSSIAGGVILKDDDTTAVARTNIKGRV